MLSAVMAPDGELAANYGATEAMPSTELGSREHLDGVWGLTEHGAGVCVVVTPCRASNSRSSTSWTVRSIPSEKPRSCPPGTSANLVRGTHVSPEYYLDPESTRKNKVPDLQGDWHRFGDVGYLDAQGRLWVCGRVSQRVKAEGGNVFPLQVEPLFDAHPKVRRSGLVESPELRASCPSCVAEVETRRGQGPAPRLTPGTSRAGGRFRYGEQDSRHPLQGRAADPRHNSKIERPRLAKWAARQLSGPRFRSRRTSPLAETHPVAET